MPRQRRVLSSWHSNASGDLIESSIKIYSDEEDGSYEIETAQDSLGVILGADKGHNDKYTIITKISNPNK